jgi:hypothetical protein
MANVNGDLERMYEGNSEIALIMNKTVNYRGSYSPSSTLSSDYVDPNTLEHFKIKGPPGKHIKLVGKYWLIFGMETQTAPYQSGVSFQDIHVHRWSPESTTKIPKNKVATLKLEREPRTTVSGEFSQNCFAHIRTHRNVAYTAVETLVQLYDFRRTFKMKHEVRLPGSFLAFSEQNIAYFAGKTVSHHFQVYNWRAKGDIATTSITITVPDERKICGIGFSPDRVVTYDGGGYLTIFDDMTGKVIDHHNIEEQTKLKGAYFALVDNVCFLKVKNNTESAGYAVIDIRTGRVIQTLKFGGLWCRLNPLVTDGNFNGKFLVNSEGDAGIIDLVSPYIHEECTVMSIPSADSVDTAQLGVKFHRVLSGKLWSQLAGLCECPGFQLDSQVLKEVELNNEKYRYVLVFNQYDSKPQSMVLNQFFADCPFQHDDSCPIQSVSLDLNTPRVPKEDFGYGVRGARYKKTTQTWPASSLKGYGTAIVLKETWSTKHGCIPSNMPDNFSLQSVISEKKIDNTEPLNDNK